MGAGGLGTNEPDAIYTTSFFTKPRIDAIVSAETRARPGKEKEMFRIQLMAFVKSEFKEHSLCSRDEQHSSLVRPYETVYADPVKCKPE